LLAVGAAQGDDGLGHTLAIGASAPDFTLPGIDGRNHSLGDYAEARI
jgi:peroxiredoxin